MSVIQKNMIRFFINNLNAEGLAARCMRGGAVLVVGSVLERGIRFARNMILARLLAPEHFGLMALAIASTQLFETLTQIGVRQAVVQNKKGATWEFLNVTWWFSMIRGVGLYIIGWSVAPFIASIYQELQLVNILRVAFMSILFQGLISPGLYVLEKQIKFNKVVLINQGAGLVGTAVSLILACLHPNVWALIIGLVVEAVFRCVGSFLVYPVRPRWLFDRQSTSELFRFSRGMIGLPFLTYIFLEADIFVLGRVCSKDILGYYSLTLSLAYIPEMIFARIAGSMMLPIFSEMQDQKERLQHNLLRLMRGLYLFGLPMVVCLVVFSRSILSIVYGSNYAELHWAYALLNIYIIFYMAKAILFFIYLALGRPELQRRFTILRVLLMIISIYPAVLWGGATGAAMAKVFCLMLPGLWELVNLKKLLDLSLYRYLDTARRGLLLAGAISLPALVWKFLIVSQWLELLGGIVLCSLAWILGMWTMWGAVKSRLSDSQTHVCAG